MILRNIAIRHGRKALAAPLRTSFLRSLTTTTQPESQVAESPFIASPFSDAIAKYSKIIENEVDEDEFNAEEEDEDIPAYWNANRPAPRRKDADDVVTNHNLRRTIKKQTGRLGSVIDPHYEPADQLLKPTRSRDITLELLMASQSHLGHATSQWNSMNQRYIYGVRAGVHIISLEETAAHLRRAAKIVEGVAYAGGLILFVGTRKGHMPPVVMAAKLAGACHLFEKWLPGTLTNGNQVLRKCEIIAVDKDDKFVDGFQDKIAEWGALKPDLVVCLNPIENYLLLHECSTNNIPTIGIIDTDADPTWVTYPIPANDDSIRCTQLIAGVLGNAGKDGKRLRLEAAAKGEVTWLPPPRLGAPLTEEEKKRLAKEQRDNLRNRDTTKDLKRAAPKFRKAAGKRGGDEW